MKKGKAAYQLFKNKLFNEEIGWYETYGIRDSRGAEVINDVTTDLLLALKIVTTLNSCNVSIVHFKEVVEDLLD